MRGLGEYPTREAECSGSEFIGSQDHFATAETVVPSLAMHALSPPVRVPIPLHGSTYSKLFPEEIR